MTKLRGNSLKILLLLATARRPWTIRELARECGIRNPHGAKCHLLRLRKLGLVTWEEGRHRTLRAKCRVERV